jgi:hypothetical protein
LAGQFVEGPAQVVGMLAFSASGDTTHTWLPRLDANSDRSVAWRRHRPSLPAAGGRAHGAEFAADVDGVQGSAGPGGEDEILVAMPRVSSMTVGVLLLFKGVHRVGGYLGGGRRFCGIFRSGVAVGADRAPHGDTGGHSQFRVRLAEVDVPSAGRGLFVRMPVARHKAM